MESIRYTAMKKETSGIGIFLILSLAAPYIYHLFNMRGVVFLPIFMGVVISTYFLSLPSVITVAVLSPIFNHLLTGMPPAAPYPMMQLLILEGIVITVTAYFLRPRTTPLLGAAAPLLAGRLSSFMLIPLFSSLTPGFILSNLILGVPGFLLNITLSMLIYLCTNRR